MRALLTRPRADSETLAETLARRGISSLIEPMLDIVPTADGPPDLAGVQAVLITSANGARALAAALGADRATPLLAVGQSSAQAARAAGFRRVEPAGGDVASLAALVAARLKPAAGALLHVTGRDQAGDLAGDLARDGFTVRRAVLYEAHAARALSAAAARALTEGTIDLALFFSPRTAEAFAGLVRSAGLAPTMGRIVALCLSPAVAESARVLDWREVRTARRPELDALLDELEGVACVANA